MSTIHLKRFLWKKSKLLLNPLLECYMELLILSRGCTKLLFVSVFLDALMNVFFQIKFHFLRAMRLNFYVHSTSPWSSEIDSLFWTC